MICAVEQQITFPDFTGLRCLMMPYIQGDPDSLPSEYEPYFDILESIFIQPGKIGFLTIDESIASKGTPHRGDRAKFGRALHTEAGRRAHSGVYSWGGGGWGSSPAVVLDRDTQILLANNSSKTCAIWNTEHLDTSEDGDIGDRASLYPYQDACIMNAGQVLRIGILTPHESLPVDATINRQFLRIIGAGVHGKESYFTQNSNFSLEIRT